MKKIIRALVIGLLLCTQSALGLSADRMQASQPNAVEPNHKVVAPADLLDVKTEGITVLHDYGSYALYRASDTALAKLSAEARAKVRIVDEMDEILIDAHPFDTQTDALDLPSALRVDAPVGRALHLVQFVGPIKAEWLAAVEAAGAIPIHYIAHNAYLVWAGSSGRNRLASLAEDGEYVQYSAPYHPYFKLGPSIQKRILAPKQAGEIVPVVIQVYDHADKSDTQATIRALTVEQVAPWSSILSYQNVIVKVRASDLEAIARLPDVVWVGERFERTMMDEVQGQILAGNLDGSQAGPSGTGYLTWLSGYGFSTDPNDYPIVDVVDDGIGSGTVNSGDSTLHQFGSLANPTRLSYVANCTSAADGGGPDGHGHINVSIAGGYDTTTGAPYQDDDGYQRGLGISPYGRFAGTRIFGPGFDLSACNSTDTGLIKSIQDNGAQIASNSWGCGTCADRYDDSSQAFDVGVRDADLTEAGNQELIFIFSAGNSGPNSGTVGTPGNGKNVIAVGASENDRATWTDGCYIGPTGADNAMDVISFSSRGPSPGGRIKPEVIAPGTHIQGTASTHANYNGSGVCDQYAPAGQTVFAASSGTSHSAPAVSGVASLYYYWLESTYGMTPSPALIKAYLIAHPTYLTGVSANDTLPSNSQGYGMPNMSLAFDSTPRQMVDQSHTFDNSGDTWTWSGLVADPSKPVRIVLAYTDQAGAIGVSPQVNDLNLAADVGGAAYLGNVFSGQWSTTGGSPDAANNYEAIFIPAGTNGAVEITITAFNIAGDGVPNAGDSTDQDFGLVCYNCAQFSDFTMSATPGERAICVPDDATYNLEAGSILGFGDPVTLSTVGEPAGTTAGFGTNPIIPPGTSVLTIGNTGAVPAGSYDIDIVGISPIRTHTTTVQLNVSTSVPGTVTLTMPADGATGVNSRPMLAWTAATQALSYDLEIATDAGFVGTVYSATVAGASHTVATDLDSSTVYHWRVRANNGCGTGDHSATSSLTTVALPGDCGPGTVPRALYSTGLENGTSGWTHGGTNDTWGLSGTRVHSGNWAWHADALDTIGDQWLQSPDIPLPAGQSPLSLRFWNYQEMEDQSNGCYDGGILEISSDGGSSWSQIPTGSMLTDPYDGPISTSYSNPLGGQDAWCGDPQNWLNSVVDLDAYAGQSVRFRFRLATDTSIGREGWSIDDVAVQSCKPPGLAINKTVGTDPAVCATNSQIAVAPDTDVTYCYEVQNTGTITLTVHDLADSELGMLLSGATFSLPPGGTAWFTETANITQTTVNTATWTAYNPGPTDVESDTDSATVIVPPAAIALNKTVGTDPAVCATSDTLVVFAARDVTYCYEVRNTGLITLTVHDLVDSELGGLLSSTTFSLPPGGTAWFTETANITQTTVNTATWTAYNPGPSDIVSDTDSATVTLAASTSLTCNGPVVDFENGIPRDWTVVDNSGGAGIVWVTTADPACGIGNRTGSAGEAACADSDAAGTSAAPYDTELVSPPFDLGSGFENIALDAAVYYDDLGTGNDRFDVDVWDGSSWSNLLSWDQDHMPEDISLDLSAYAGSTGLRVRLRYLGDGYDWYAQVDDIALSCTYLPAIEVDPVHLGSVQASDVQVTQTLTISNTGSADLVWNLKEALPSPATSVDTWPGRPPSASIGTERPGPGLFVEDVMLSALAACNVLGDIPWARAVPTAGTTISGTSSLVNVVLDSGSLTRGVYTGTFCVYSNDISTPVVPISLTLTVTRGARAPVAVDDTDRTDEDMPVTVSVLSNDSDPDGDVLSVVAVGLPGSGTATTDGATVVYTPTLNWNGTDTFTYTVSDGQLADTARVTMLVDPVNDAPRVEGDSYATAKDTTLNVVTPGVLGNDSDADGDPLTAGWFNGPFNGTLALHVDGSFVYTPTLGFAGVDAFTYRASDGTYDSSIATVTILVTDHFVHLPIVFMQR